MPLLNRPLRTISGKQHDQPLRLPPVAKVDRVAGIAKPLSAPRRFPPGLSPEQRDHFGRKRRRCGNHCHFQLNHDRRPFA